jgi:H+/Cl- antiporter ClcA
MSDSRSEREERAHEKDLLLVAMGVILGIIGQALYDMLRNTYALFFPHLSPNWIDLFAAAVAASLLSLVFGLRMRRRG